MDFLFYQFPLFFVSDTSMLDMLAAAADLQAQADKAAKEVEDNKLKKAEIKKLEVHSIS